MDPYLLVWVEETGWRPEPQDSGRERGQLCLRVRLSCPWMVLLVWGSGLA